MPITPSGELAIPLENMRVLLAHCAAFQAWVNDPGDAAKAKGHVYPVDLPPPTDEDGQYTIDELRLLRPLAVVDTFVAQRGWGEQPWRTDRIADGAYADSGKLMLDFVADVADEHAGNPADCKIAFLNDVGAILAELKQRAGTTDYLTAADIAAGVGGFSIHRIELYQGPRRADETEVQTQGDHWRMQFLVHWGV